jgi:hypothetical protein
MVSKVLGSCCVCSGKPLAGLAGDCEASIERGVTSSVVSGGMAGEGDCEILMLPLSQLSGEAAKMLRHRPAIRTSLWLDIEDVNDLGLRVEYAVDLDLLADETAWHLLVVEVIDVRLRCQHELPAQVHDAVLGA